MTNEQIEKFLENDQVFNNAVRISFKTRNSIKGLFLKMADFDELKAKNYWRVVPESNISSWQKTKSMNLARIFHGQEFTKLTPEKAVAA